MKEGNRGGEHNFYCVISIIIFTEIVSINQQGQKDQKDDYLIFSL